MGSCAPTRHHLPSDLISGSTLAIPCHKGSTMSAAYVTSTSKDVRRRLHVGQGDTSSNSYPKPSKNVRDKHSSRSGRQIEKLFEQCKYDIVQHKQQAVVTAWKEVYHTVMVMCTESGKVSKYRSSKSRKLQRRAESRWQLNKQWVQVLSWLSLQRCSCQEGMSRTPTQPGRPRRNG
jgi:hypothetical protein